ncbi:hypothetical protein H2198_003955 [Neophaeococcomyces mojaviensis]|uniref:Uncharacterized protein n=1 Tax=Neophaeococcomyces mojaviensis TaxID=3383035 RepID=A0ACC3A9U6_9EURO|nr:hypothetical protein H2198_003955 [Knufia sp. JES_112]
MADRILSSSPLSSAPSTEATFRTASSQPSSHYHSARSLPYELLQHVQVYLEESLFSQALHFLLSLTTASLKDSRSLTIPPPDYLAVIATLCVHPSLTTRTTSRDKWTQSNDALKLLRIINQVTGPVNAGLTEAYKFRRYTERLSIRRGVTSEDDSNVNNHKLNISYADTDSLFSLAEDFWALIGWALNSACLPGYHATRWEHYAPFLNYLLDVLETDWSLREETDTCSESLFWQYIEQATGGNARGRRILRAIFADGSTASLNEFREIFRKELKGPKSNTEKLKKQEVAVDIDGEIYGDWMQEGESSTEEENEAVNSNLSDPLNIRPKKRIRTRTPSARRKVTPKTSKRSLIPTPTDNDDSDVSMSEAPVTQPSLGGPESITIRLRLLQLLSTVSANTTLIDSQTEPVFPDLHDLYTLFVEFIRPLPLSVFQQFVLSVLSASLSGSTKASISPHARVTLCEFMLQRMIDRESHKRSTFEPMTQARLASDYLPYAAVRNTVEAQAKVSLLLESVVRQLAKAGVGYLKQSSELIEALEQGVKNRQAAAAETKGNRKKGRDGGDEELAGLVLQESAMRMRIVIQRLDK